MTTIGNVGASVPQGFGTAFYSPGAVSASQKLGKFVAVYPGRIPANFTGSFGKVDVAPASNWSGSLTINGTTFGTTTLGAGNSVMSLSSGADQTVNPGDVIEWLSAASDTAMSDPALTIIGYSS
jgi:hypothetical protein